MFYSEDAFKNNVINRFYLSMRIVFQVVLQYGDVVTFLLDLVCPFFSVSSCHPRLGDGEIRSLCRALAVTLLVHTISHWIITINGKMNVWKCKLGLCN